MRFAIGVQKRRTNRKLSTKIINILRIKLPRGGSGMIRWWKKGERFQDKWQIDVVVCNWRDGSLLCGFIR